MTDQQAFAKEQNAGSAARDQCEVNCTHFWDHHKSKASFRKNTAKQVWIARQETRSVNRLRGTSHLRRETFFCCRIAFVKVWSPPVFTATSTPHPKVKWEGTSIAYLTPLLESSESSRRGWVAVWCGLDVMCSRWLHQQSYGIERPVAA